MTYVFLSASLRWERGEIHSHDMYRDCESRKTVRSRRKMFCRCVRDTRYPSLFITLLHCKLNFSCIIVTEIISCRSVERVVERKRIHVLQEQIIACFFGLSFFFFFSRNPYIHPYIRRKSINGNIEIIAKEVVLAWTLLLTFPFEFIFLFYARSLT